ncbi:uncharacterized protein KY384_008151 [Bacidia gigantensis]|uniref:uncharacterized protein n=1 Tax=Bacidia gigantensis TaxID=2732470 RepID=UPI001D054A31|nr:uncharacterized protein KY384_008151 [Bacidia gigantensis]KAG8526722.1 hypothetical protein KY384_008151 [Bacidia gigantensis]
MAPSSATPISIPTFARTQLELLAAEQAAETAQTATLLSSSSPATLASAGLALTNLVLSAQRTGLGGKTVVELEVDSAVVGKDSSGGGVEHGIRVGDIVRVGVQPKGAERKREKAELDGKGVEGVVVRSRRNGIEVAVDEGAGGKGEEGLDGLLGGRLWV